MTVASTIPGSVSAREGYAQWAATYDSDINPVAALQERMLRAILPEARAKTVVDLGCGTGHTLALWRERHPARLIGIDSSLEMLRRGGATESLVAADCCALPLGSGSVDIVSCCLTLGYIANLDSFASEVARIVSPGGTVLISELHPESAVRFGWRRGFTQSGKSVKIEARAVPIQEIVDKFKQYAFRTDLLLEVPFGTPELALFEAAGRGEYFERFREYPAIYILQLRRAGSPGTTAEPMTLRRAKVALSAAESLTTNVTIADQAICSLGLAARDEMPLDLSGYLLLPGLINAHDHLEFALFPRLGKGPYQNSREWAEEIYRPEESPVREHLLVPKWVRLWCGAIRNLLCGVTTVCHHNPYDPEVFGEDFPVRVVRDVAWSHSLAFDSEIATRFRESDSSFPFVTHAAEGVDRASREEVHTLLRLRLLGARTVIVHGAALDDEGLAVLKNCGAALVWCPSSNIFLFNQTLAPDQVASLPSKALGSDSPLTAVGDLLDEVRFAATLGTSPETLYELVTSQATRVLRLKQGEGRIYPGAVADVIAVRDRGLSPADTLRSLSYRDVELVITSGRVRLVSDEMKALLPARLTAELELLTIDGLRRWVRAPVRQLLELSREALGPEISICGRSLTQ